MTVPSPLIMPHRKCANDHRQVADAAAVVVRFLDEPHQLLFCKYRVEGDRPCLASGRGTSAARAPPARVGLRARDCAARREGDVDGGPARGCAGVPDRLCPVARLNGRTYAHTRTRFSGEDTNMRLVYGSAVAVTVAMLVPAMI